MREWIASPESEVIKSTLREIDLPSARNAGSFDLRAWKIWKYVAENVQYVTDEESSGVVDFWLYPAETLTLRKGDCEDSSFLLASLLLASGISDHCFRVVLGKVQGAQGDYGHAWVVYQGEDGKWCQLESTANSVPPSLVQADPLTESGAKDRYEPQFCLNRAHLWLIYPAQMQMAEYIQMRETTPGGRPGASL
ncbi:MAG: transglutaminase-like cysteine peptidase [Methanosarcinales archaeon]|nr:transglutaminase-like cysteine peptidase [Methanosarcinales archaeon]